MARQQFVRMIIALILFGFSGIFIYLATVLIFGLFPWQPDDPLWIFANWLNMRAFWIVLLYYGIGYIIIVRHYWMKPFRYFQELLDAAEIVSRQDDSLVSLSPALSDLESRLNQIKFVSMNNLRAAKEAEQRKNDLVTYLAHDRKTPITSVIGYLTLLRDEPQISDEMRRRYMNIALDKAERLDDLINEFFEITRFNLSHISLEKKQINLSLMLQQLTYEFQPMLAEKNLTCSLNAPENLMLRCDPDKLQRVFDNLLRNAVNYSFPNSEIKITASEEISQNAGDTTASGRTGSSADIFDSQTKSAADSPADLFGSQTESTTGSIRLIFENRGDTISREKLDRLFEQFYRLDSSRSTKRGGAGLGLAIAKEIAELHGGNVVLESVKGVGTTVTVMLPNDAPDDVSQKDESPDINVLTNLSDVLPTKCYYPKYLD